MKVMLEVVPPSKLLPGEKREKIIESVSSAISSADIDFINVPEIVDENKWGMPYYRNVDSCAFAERLAKATQKDVIANKPVVYFDGKEDFLKWLGHAVKVSKIKNFVFVGGGSSRNRYSGPTVAEANRLALQNHDVKVGNILIPTRSNESEKMLEKTKAGCSFFTTQVLFSAEPLKSVLRSYYSACAQNSIEPAEIFLSFSPVSSQHDVEFMKWLGVDIPAKTEHAILSDHNPDRKSIEIASEVWNQVSSDYPEAKLGLNIEPLFQQKMGSAMEMLNQMRRDS